MTAVEKLELSLLGIISFDSEELRLKYKDILAKAKELEKQQTIDAYERGDKYKSEPPGTDYYEETFNK